MENKIKKRLEELLSENLVNTEPGQWKDTLELLISKIRLLAVNLKGANNEKEEFYAILTQFAEDIGIAKPGKETPNENLSPLMEKLNKIEQNLQKSKQQSTVSEDERFLELVQKKAEQLSQKKNIDEQIDLLSREAKSVKNNRKSLENIEEQLNEIKEQIKNIES